MVKEGAKVRREMGTEREGEGGKGKEADALMQIPGYAPVAPHLCKIPSVNSCVRTRHGV